MCTICTTAAICGAADGGGAHFSLPTVAFDQKDKGRPWPQFIHDFEVNCSKQAQVKMMILPLCQCKHIHFSGEKYFLAVI